MACSSVSRTSLGRSELRSPQRPHDFSYCGSYVLMPEIGWTKGGVGHCAGMFCLIAVASASISQGRATRRPPYPKIDCFVAAQRCSPQYVEIDVAIPHRQRRSPQGNSCFAITTPPAARMAHFRTMARRRFGSSRPTASNSNAATRITIDTYRLANMGQWLASYKERSPSGSAGPSQTMCEFDRPTFAGRWAITQAQSTVVGFGRVTKSD